MTRHEYNSLRAELATARVFVAPYCPKLGVWGWAKEVIRRW